MINNNSVERIRKSVFNEFFIKPDYDFYCFSKIPSLIKNVLTGDDSSANSFPQDIFGELPQKYDKVILLLVDGFGWKKFMELSGKYPFLSMLLNNGALSKITSQFPSTTSAQITTLNTGLNVGQSGVYEWNYYEPEVDAVITPLLFSFAGIKQKNSLESTGISPEKIFPYSTFFSELLSKNISTYQFINNDISNAPYNKTLSKDSVVFPCATFPETLTNLTDHVMSNNQKSYYYIYFGNYDSIAHTYGPDSKQANAEADIFLYSLQKLFMDKLNGKLKNTLFIMTADHGQNMIDPQKTVYLNLQFPQIIPWIKQNKKGELLVGAGSCRDMFLHIKEEQLEEAHKFLTEKLSSIAVVYKTADLIHQNFFGTTSPSELFKNRIGNLVIACKPNETVWWYEKDRFEIKYRGHHGGLSADEMEIPLALYAF